MLTLTELAQYLSLHECTVRKYAAAGRIPAMRIGRVWRFDKEDIDRWIAGSQNNPGSNDHSREKTTPKKDGRHREGGIGLFGGCESWFPAGYGGNSRSF
jgi:excisionase family DNA binding protein